MVSIKVAKKWSCRTFALYECNEGSKDETHRGITECVRGAKAVGLNTFI